MSIYRELRRAFQLARQRVLEGHLVVLVVPVVKPLAEDPVQLDPPWKREFLGWLRKGRTVKVSAELAGVTKRHANRSYHKDPAFARAWDAIRRSLEGGPSGPLGGG